MKLALFIVFLTLYFYESEQAFCQQTDNQLYIDFGETNFSIERPFTLTLLIRDSDQRPMVVFPDVPGLLKQGTSVSTTRSEVNGRVVTNQLVTQTYLATRPGTVRVAPFTLVANGQSVKSPGLVLTVKASAEAVQAAMVMAKANADTRAAFLQTSVNQSSVYPGEALSLKLSFFVAENYPYELSFNQLEQQVAAIVRKIRPVNAWEENDIITELKPRPARIDGRRYVEYRLYQSTFFLLKSRTAAPASILLPDVALRVTRQATAIPADKQPVAQAETVTFMSQPVTVQVRPLPVLRSVKLLPAGQISVGTFQLADQTDRTRVLVGQSVRYEITVRGQGNIAGILPPQVVGDKEVIDVFPPQVQEQIGRTGAVVSGSKTFRYFLIPKQKGTLSLAERFFWVYFDTRNNRYDTLHPKSVLRVGGPADGATAGVVPPDTTLDGYGRPSIYAGLEHTNSGEQTVNWPVLIRAAANVLIVVMILGTLIVFARK